MKYIAKYNRFVDETGRVFRKKNNGNIVECEQSISKTGYNWYRRHNNKCRWEV